MKKNILKIVSIVIILILLRAATARSASVLFPVQGGTGIGSATTTDVGKVLVVSSSSPFRYSFSAIGTGNVSATGTPYFVPYFTSTNTLATSSLSASSTGQHFGINTLFPSTTLHVVGTFRTSDTSTFDTAIIGSYLTASRLLVSDASKNVSSTDVTATEAGYLSGVTSNIQTQLDGKQATLTTGNLTATSPLSFNNTRQVIGGAAEVSIQNAAADGATKGAASFGANDFDASSGNITLDYTNGQSAGAATKGYLTSTDWNTFSNKVSANGATGYIPAFTGTSTIGTSTLFASSTLIGLNTLFPSSTLHVVGTFRTSGVSTFGDAISPVSNDGAALGSASVSWSDLFLASQGVINFANGSSTITHGNGLTFAGGTITTPTSSQSTTTISNQLTLSAITGSTQCLQVNSSGVVSGTGSACGGSGSTPGGSDTFIQFNDAGTFGGNANFVFNSSTPAVGIGTQFPSSTLHVVGSTTLSGTSTIGGQLTLSSITGSTQCLHADSSGIVTGTGSDCGAGGGSASGTIGNIQLSDGSSGFTASSTFTFDGSVGALGIGTLYPSTSLHIVNTTADGQMRLNGANVVLSVSSGASVATAFSYGGSSLINAGATWRWGHGSIRPSLRLQSPSKGVYLGKDEGFTTGLGFAASNPSVYLYASSTLGVTVSSTDATARIKVGVGSNNDHPSSTLHIVDTASTTLTIGKTNFPSCIAMQDTDGAGFTYITALNGVLTASSTKPLECDAP